MNENQSPGAVAEETPKTSQLCDKIQSELESNAGAAFEQLERKLGIVLTPGEPGISDPDGGADPEIRSELHNRLLNVLSAAVRTTNRIDSIIKRLDI